MRIARYPVSVKAIIFREGKVLMIKKKRKGREEFGFPGGLVEYKESLEEACKREVLEEIGIGVKIVKLLYATKYDHPLGSENVGIYYLCEPLARNFKLKEEKGQEFLELVWVDENDKIPEWAKELIKKFKQILKIKTK